jgi:predicted nucleic-acid-binding Zn-ribbon protein
MRNHICPKCGSTEVVPPGAFIHKGSETSTLRAWVCGRCGYTELYAPNCRALLAAHKQSQA